MMGDLKMAELEKVIKGLEICIRVQDNEKCPDECPYRKDICYGTVGLMADALSLLKAQEARVMTLEEIEDALDNVVWLDIPGAENLADGFSLIMAYSRKNGFVLLDSPFGDNPSQDRFEYTYYNKTWRCWTARPTDEQREAVKWDG